MGNTISVLVATSALLFGAKADSDDTKANTFKWQHAVEDKHKRFWAHSCTTQQGGGQDWASEFDDQVSIQAKLQLRGGKCVPKLNVCRIKCTTLSAHDECPTLLKYSGQKTFCKDLDYRGDDSTAPITNGVCAMAIESGEF